MVGHRATVAQATGLELQVTAVEPMQEFEEQPRLADARIADEHEGGAGALHGSRVGQPQRLHLVVAAEQRRQPALARNLQPCAPEPLPHDGPAPDGLALALHGEHAEVFEVEEPGGQPVRLGGADGLAGLGDVEHARGEVGGVADRGVVHAQVAPDGAHHDQAGVDADAQAELDAVQPPHVVAHRLQVTLDGQGGAERAVRVVLVGDGGAEERHDAVAQELVDGALEAVDRAQDDLEDPVHDAVDLLGVQALGHRREAGDVREHHADLLALALHGRAAAEDLLGQVLGRVGLRGGEPLGRGRRLLGGGRGRRRGRGGPRSAPQRGAALTAELLPRRVLALAGRADGLQPASALTAELLAGRIVVAATEALHQRGGPRVACRGTSRAPRSHLPRARETEAIARGAFGRLEVRIDAAPLADDTQAPCAPLVSDSKGES